MTAVLIARYTVKPGQVDAVREALGRMAASVAADEPACLLYNASVSVDNDHLFCLYEVYQDEAGLLAHRDTPHFKEIIEGTVVPLLENREREVYTRVLG